MNPIVKKTAEDFMKNSVHNEHAYELVKEKVAAAKNDGWTKSQMLEHLENHGYLKTEMDKKIVDAVFTKNKLREDKETDRNRRREIFRKQEVFTDFVRQSKEATTEQDRRNMRTAKKFF